MPKENPMLPDTAASKVTAAHLSRTALLYLLSELRDNVPAQRPIWPWRRKYEDDRKLEWQLDEDVTEARAPPKADIQC